MMRRRLRRVVVDEVEVVVVVVVAVGARQRYGAFERRMRCCSGYIGRYSQMTMTGHYCCVMADCCWEDAH